MEVVSNSEQVGKVAEELECPVCLNLYDDPRVLDCMHTFCSDCLIQGVKDGSVVCPVCRTPTTVDVQQGVASLRPNYVVRNVVEAVKKMQEQGEKPQLLPVVPGPKPNEQRANRNPQRKAKREGEGEEEEERERERSREERARGREERAREKEEKMIEKEERMREKEERKKEKEERVREKEREKEEKAKEREEKAREREEKRVERERSGKR